MSLASGAVAVADPVAPWLEIRAQPARAVVYASGGRADAVVNLELVNRRDHLVRVRKVRMLFLAGDRVLRTGPLGDSFFSRSLRVGRDRRVEWRAICLESPPEEADRVRFELKLSGRKGLRRFASYQSVEIHLERPPESTLLRLPFHGYWRVDQGHACSTWHRVGSFGGDFAWDFAALGPTGRSVNEAYETARRNEDAYSFGRAILAPADGRVVRVISELPDNEGLKEYPRRSLLDNLKHPEWIFGNFVLLDLRNGSYVILGHLMQDSISVQVGDAVRAGQPIARCGNSGNTFKPHLHLQVMDRADPADPEVRGLPGAFANYMEFTMVGDGEQRDLRARRVSAGDPPQGSVVGPARRGTNVVPDSRTHP